MALRGLWTFLSRGKQHRAGKQAARVYIPSDSLVAQGQWSLQASVCSWLIDRESGVAHLDSASLEMCPWHLRAREQVEEDVKEFCITTFSSTSHLMLTMIGNKIQHLACPVASSVICPSALLQCYLNPPSFSGLLAIFLKCSMFVPTSEFLHYLRGLDRFCHEWSQACFLLLIQASVYMSPAHRGLY